MKLYTVPELAPALGQCCHAVRMGNLLYVSGQVPFDVQGNVVGTTVVEQAEQTLQNLATVLFNCGLTLSDVIKTTVYFVDSDDFPKINKVYARYFGNHRPTRAIVEVSRLAKRILVEIEAIAEYSAK